MGAYDHCPLLPQFPDQPAHFHHLYRIQTVGGFIQEQDIRITHQHGGKPHTLTEALGQLSDETTSHGRKTAYTDCLTDRRIPFSLFDLSKLCLKPEELLHRQLRIEGRNLRQVSDPAPGFYRMLSLLEILYELSLQDNYHLLASKSFANVKNQPESRRVRAVEEHIDQNFKKEIRLKTLADIAGMTPAAFSRFFRTRTGKTVSDYIIDIRLGYAARLLVDTHTNVAEICYSCGFNNISNFNRIFKKKKGCSPTAFRDNYHKSKIII